ncbi:DUF748 domain-containing protein [Pistricoccus aurantiacus]|uniref:DUF748 domain-containing protein n=1 Tax=Pistricoccus aurantiacus TaxID=1883414 RepID=UPI0036386975
MTAKSHSAKGWFIALGILVILALLITVTWLWLLPYFIEKRLVETFSSLTGREVTIKQVSIDPFDAQVTLDQLRIAGEKDQPVLTSETVIARLQWRSLWESGWWLDSLMLKEPRLRLIRRQDGNWNLVRLFAGDEDTSQGKTPIRIARIEVHQGELDLVNRRLPDPVTLTLSAIRMSAKNYDNTNDQPFTLEGRADWNGGTLSGQGEMGFAPWTLNLDFTIDQVPLTTLSGYFNSVMQARMTKGTLAAELNLKAGRAGDGATQVRGEGNITDAVLSYPDKQQPLAKVTQLDIAGLNFDSDAKTLEVQHIALDAPWTEVIIDKDLKTNLDAWRPPQQKNGSQGAGLSYSIDEIGLNDGSLVFADRHLSQPFDLEFSQLGGAWKNLDSDGSDESRIDLQGRVAENSPLRIQGSFDPLGEAVEGDLQMHFEQLNLATFSPYVRRFGGYAIDQGQMTLQLDHRIEKGRLITENHVELRRIELGEKVEDSAGGLPMRTLIDILQSDDGVIELDVPMTLPLDNPSAVEIGKVMDDAIEEALENALSSPVETLSEATGIGDE